MPTTSISRRSLLALGTAGLWPAHEALALNRVVKIVVPYAAGAVQDTLARAFNGELGQVLGATAIVENRAGAGGTVGAAMVAKAPPDGNTLLMAAASHNIAAHLYKNLPFDPLKNFVGVANMGNAGYAVMVSSSMPKMATLADFIREVKANPGKYNYASAGNGSATHLAMAALLAKAGLKMAHIPMKSTGEAVNEVLAGRAQAAIPATIGVMGYQNDARVKLLASCGAQRSPFLPSLPTVAEAGVPGYVFESWMGLLAPAATPRQEIDRLHAAANKVLTQPTVLDRFKSMGVEPRTQSVDDFQKLLRADYDAMAQVVKDSGTRIE